MRVPVRFVYFFELELALAAIGTTFKFCIIFRVQGVEGVDIFLGGLFKQV